MKYIFLTILFVLAGCSSTTSKNSTNTSTIDFDISAGQYEAFQLSTWEVGTNECLEFSLNKSYNTTKWLAALMFYMNDESKKEMSKIMLHTEQPDSKTLTLAYAYGKKEYQAFVKNIKFGEVIKFEVQFPNDHTVSIKIGASEFSFPVKFKINNISVGASSAQAKIKTLESSECTKQI